MTWTFEPHGGFGQTIAGEAMPFGYISEEAPNQLAQPIFQLDPVHDLPVAELHAAALKMAAADDLLRAAIWAEAALAPFSKDPAEKSGISMLRAAIAKAQGGAS